MTLSLEEIRKISHLSQLGLTDDELVFYQKDLNNILDWMAMIDSVTTESVDILYDQNQEGSSVWRRDIIVSRNSREDILSNSTEAKYGFYSVPKVIK